jgi:hypothetical protein
MRIKEEKLSSASPMNCLPSQKIQMTEARGGSIVVPLPDGSRFGTRFRMREACKRLYRPHETCLV